MIKVKRKRIMTHSTEDEKEEMFMGLKEELQILTELNDLYPDDE